MAQGLVGGVAGVVALVALMAVASDGYNTKSPQLQDVAQVRLRQGVIFAPREEAGENRFFYSFKGIPYAQPPVGKLRFKDPVPADGWRNARNGSIAPPLCPQLSVEARLQGRTEVTGDEDCLYLNVYAPAPLPTGLPVMVWIHGGGFQDGGGEDLYAPLPLMTRDIILVTVHFRLGTLGYLSTEDSVMPGNLGLKDATLALRWVQENIGDFGGDPAKVTLFGESSGGATVHFLLMTPKANGLFSRAIMQSGTALCPWAVREDHMDVAQRLGQMLNCSDNVKTSEYLDSTQLLACFQQIPTEQLVLLAYAFRVWNFWPSVMRPRVDGDFIPDHPATLIRTGRFNNVDLIAGVTEHEGATDCMGTLVNKTLRDSVGQDFNVAGPASLLIEPYDVSPIYTARRVYYRYLGDTKVTLDKAEEFMQMFSDAYYKVCKAETVYFHTLWREAGRPAIFKYELQHRGRHSLADIHQSTLNKDWVGHADDLQYLFNGKPSLRPRLTRPGDLFVREVMLTLWTNFAATGNPTPDGSLGFRWWPTTESKQWFLALTTSPTMKEDSPTAQVLDFWKNLPTKRNMLLYPELFERDQKCPVPIHCYN